MVGYISILSHLKLQSRLEQRETSLQYGSTLGAKGIFGPYTCWRYFVKMFPHLEISYPFETMK